MSQGISDRQQERICVIGSGYVGLVAALCLAEIGHKVVCVDNDASKITLLNQGAVPIFEEHLSQLLRKHLGAGVTFTTDLGAAIDVSDVVFIAVGTPQGESGAADLSYVEGVVSAVASHIHRYKVIVEKSTVPVYTNEQITRCLLQAGVHPEDFDVVSNPEFLREGSAVSDFLHPDRIVVGTGSERAAARIRRVYEPLCSGQYYSGMDAIRGPLSEDNPAKLLVTSAQSAELIKHASNAFLAMKISFINAVANLAECVDGDVEEIAAGIGLDSRIGPRFLSAGLGYGGSCFPKDVAAFRWVAQQEGVNFKILEEVSRINAHQIDVFLDKVRTVLWNLRGKRVAALGLAFKGGTDDVRESPAIEAIRRLLAAGCEVRAYDPEAMEKAQAILGAMERLEYAEDAYSAAASADVLLLLTDWDEFRTLDLERIGRLMRFRVIVDGRNLYRPAHMERHGFTYISMGRRDLNQVPTASSRQNSPVQLRSAPHGPVPAVCEESQTAALTNI